MILVTLSVAVPPGRREEILARPDYFWLRDSVVDFLEEQVHA